MKIVINDCFGGFSLSPLGVKRMAELRGEHCYFFAQNIKGGLNAKYDQATIEEAEKAFIFWAFTVPNPTELLGSKDWREMDNNERTEYNSFYKKYNLSNRDFDRNDPLLVQVVEELGAKANGKCAELKVVEIPDEIEYVIEEYDGNEWVAEKHRTWR